ncbi:transmembrane protein 69-like [Thalassophryne amazonica]|uniref:transmembrane protein 69-like n=1 Tax=Thalassophryne amazonica TaxID=390379 RepID=UPI001472557B|nr:transmembrane protein 69-like [Thalassophryne amazonica]
MLSLTCRRSIFTAQKAWCWTDLPRRCWFLAPVSGSHGGSIRHSLHPWQTSSVCLPSKDMDARQGKMPLLSGFRKTGVIQGTQNHIGTSLVPSQYFHCSASRLKKRPKKEPPPRELDLLRYDMMDLNKSPKPAKYLGFAGLLPFIMPPVVMAISECYMPVLAYIQVAYGAAIISFLGGARWGFALPESSPADPDWINLSNSMVPPLLAWVAMLMVRDSITSATIIVIMGLGITLHYDLSLLPSYPSWLKALCCTVAIVAFLSLIGTLVISEVYESSVQ